MGPPMIAQVHEAKLAYWREYNRLNSERKKAYSKLYYAANREKLTAYRRDYVLQNRDVLLLDSKQRYAAAKDVRVAQKAIYREANRALVNANAKKYRDANPEKLKESKRSYLERNRGAIYAKCKLRTLSKKQRTPKWLTLDDIWIMKQAYELAVLRTYMFGFKWHVDHILPLNGELVSGLHVPANLQVLPGRVNIQKRNKYEVQ